MRQLAARENVDFSDPDLDALRQLAAALGNRLMDLEMQQVEQFEVGAKYLWVVLRITYQYCLI
jgi:hypothetical protein